MLPFSSLPFFFLPFCIFKGSDVTISDSAVGGLIITTTMMYAVEESTAFTKLRTRRRIDVLSLLMKLVTTRSVT